MIFGPVSLSRRFLLEASTWTTRRDIAFLVRRGRYDGLGTATFSAGRSASLARGAFWPLIEGPSKQSIVGGDDPAIRAIRWPLKMELEKMENGTILSSPVVGFGVTRGLLAQPTFGQS